MSPVNQVMECTQTDMNNAKKALITGITGQDGSYLAELLLAKGYEVHGVIRRASTFNTGRLDHLYSEPHQSNQRLWLHYGDVLDGSRIHALISEIKPDEIYNLAAQSHVRVSFDEPTYTGDSTALGVTRVLEAILASGHHSKFYQASSSEMFGLTPPPQGENSRFYPRSPYGVSKLYGHWATVNYREAHDMFAVSGILFNHESPRRGETFVTRKISRAVARIANGKQDKLYLGNLDSTRDWGYAPEYVVAMWRMLQQDQPRDFVIGTGSSSSVRDFLEYSFQYVDLDWRKFVEFDEKYIRPTEVDALRSDPKTANESIWEHTVTLEQLAHEMVRYDLVNIGEKQIDSPIGDLWKSEAQ